MKEAHTDSSGVLDQTPTPLADLAAARAALEGCRLLLLTATAEEASPLFAALEDARRLQMATKTVVTGRLLCTSESSGVLPCAREEGTVRAIVAVGGCDKADTAHMLTCLLQTMSPPPRLVMQVGIAGAFVAARGAHPLPGDVVLATEEVYADAGSSSPQGWLSADDLGLPFGDGEGCGSAIRFPLDPDLVRGGRRACGDGRVLDWARGYGRVRHRDRGAAGRVARSPGLRRPVPDRFSSHRTCGRGHRAL